VRRGSIGYLEVAPLNSRLADELRAPSTDGLVVMRMARGAAYQAGLRPGDVILSVNARPVTDAAAFLRSVADADVGTVLTIEVLRDAARQTVKIPVQQEAARAR
jgi:S1-C subfamily serine protease